MRSDKYKQLAQNEKVILPQLLTLYFVILIFLLLKRRKDCSLRCILRRTKMYMYLWMQTSYAKQSSDILELLGVDIPRKKNFLQQNILDMQWPTHNQWDILILYIFFFCPSICMFFEKCKCTSKIMLFLLLKARLYQPFRACLPKKNIRAAKH